MCQAIFCKQGVFFVFIDKFLGDLFLLLVYLLSVLRFNDIKFTNLKLNKGDLTSIVDLYD